MRGGGAVTFDELLARHKAASSLEDALIPVLQPELLLFAAAWRRVPMERVREVPEGDSWEALWACVRVNTKTLATLVDVHEAKAAAVSARLIALHLVYPDGTMPEVVKKLINKSVNDALQPNVR